MLPTITITTLTLTNAISEALARQNEYEHPEGSGTEPFTFLYDVTTLDAPPNTIHIEFGNPLNLNELLIFELQVVQLPSEPMDELPNLI